jgi:hypothetical protein
MDADFSIELGHDDPVLDFPWADPEGKLAYVNLKRHPELISKIQETQRHPALADFLNAMNSPRSGFETAKCDIWATSDLTAEEDIYRATHKFASYVDLLFTAIQASAGPRQSLPAHEQFARNLVDLLHRAPELSASVEVCVRACFFAAAAGSSQGFYFTVYVNGYGVGEASAQQNWEIALKLAENAILQLSV